MIAPPRFGSLHEHMERNGDVDFWWPYLGFRIFLEASDWPIGEDFPRKALEHGLRRQAIGLAQRGRIDVVEPIAAQFPLTDIATLDELATELFAVGPNR